MVVRAQAWQRMSLLRFQTPYKLLQVIFLIYMLAYFAIALHTFYRESWPKSILKFFALQLIVLPILAITIELASHTP